MVQKPKIQYVGQFYVHGSEARALELEERRKQTKTKLPLARLQKIENIYVDPVAIFGIAVAVVMLVTMVIGVVQLKNDWAAYEKMSGYLSWLNQENARLYEEYREGYDLEDIQSKAQALGLVESSELQTRTVYVTMPEEAPQVSYVDEIKTYLEDMFA